MNRVIYAKAAAFCLNRPEKLTVARTAVRKMSGQRMNANRRNTGNSAGNLDMTINKIPPHHQCEYAEVMRRLSINPGSRNNSA